MADPPVVAHVLATCPRLIAMSRAAYLCDFPFWKSLADAAVPQSRVCDMIIDVTLTYLKIHSRACSRRSKGR
jgi:hypothetical protein